MTRTLGLTPRQHAFLDKLLELYRETKRPVHYSAVAMQLGVNRFSAYDMLKVLEQKGFASSSYALSAGHAGPGRSLVVFAPTAQGFALSASEGVDRQADEDWSSVRERVLKRLYDARETNYREVIADLLARLPESKAPLVYCTQMVGVLLLNMRRVRARAGGLNPFRALSTFHTGDDTGLEALAGLSVGATLSVDEETDASLTRRLLDYVQRYQANLGHLSHDARRALAQFLEEAIDTIDPSKMTDCRGDP